VRRETERFATWRRELEAAPALQAVWRQAEELRRAELGRHGAGVLSAAEGERLDRVTASLVRRLLHGPCERLREACAMPGADGHVESFRMLFGVDAAQAQGG
jgi:glutamyl-tRNA reductase